MNGLYAIIDTDSLQHAELEVVRFADAVLSATPAALQLRHKGRDTREHLRLLRALAPMCAEAGVPLFANDRVDLALIAGCAGVHLGQQDLPPSAARQLAEGRGHADFRIGMSVHNAAELAIAVAEEPDYIALGPVFDTQSKGNPDPTIGQLGLSALAEAAREAFRGSARTVPLVAIGGIDRARASLVAGTCEMAAVIGALLDGQAADPYQAAADRAAALQQALRAGTS